MLRACQFIIKLVVCVGIPAALTIAKDKTEGFRTFSSYLVKYLKRVNLS